MNNPKLRFIIITICAFLNLIMIVSLCAGMIFFKNKTLYLQARNDVLIEFIQCMDWEHQYRGLHSDVKRVCIEKLNQK